ncbi:LCP family protein [Megasphaera vaginalis (ex Srinivasan et al. 2021)]|uniref:Cell envelope-related transcriptional attenuator domain-containing protein n=1 Tax=Megasphaera vaginalis (ex Srinivasan et al. 2021) TaxID=1111454 RepID=U7UFZ3_9FIRM|nr:LCP family protein [Megasphaera vaginalis (ex Srinivasan et al. 2021)]ERT58352.1 hypothetical protein HMPREF1250_1108 [Megasphaera vaginalis (ex Srinivasan et al. 2021)]
MERKEREGRRKNVRLRLQHTKQKKGHGKAFHILLTLVLIFAAVAAAAYGWYQYQAFRGDTEPARGNTATEAFDQVSPDIPLYVLIIGVDDEKDRQANFVAVAAINKEKQTVDFISLPDNTRIDGRKEKGPQTLASVYTEGGLTLVQAVIEDMFHIPIKYYAVFTTDNFRKMMDMNGGLNLYVEKDVYHEDAAGVTDIDLQKGYQYLNGETGIGYLRYLDADGDLSRVQRQLRFIKSFYRQEKEAWVVRSMLNMYRFWTAVESNISAKDMARLVWTFRHVGADDVKFYILPGETAKNANLQGDGTNYWIADPVEVQRIIGKTNNTIVYDDAKTGKQTSAKNASPSGAAKRENQTANAGNTENKPKGDQE